MKRSILKRVLLLTMVLLFAFSVIPAELIEDSLSAYASDVERELKATTPTWLSDAIFDAMVYRDRYTDLAGKTDAQLKDHFYSNGIKDGRAGSAIFDVAYYLEKNSDLKSAFGTNYEKAYNHFISGGYLEERTFSRLVSGYYYKINHPQVAAEYKNEALRHYIQAGMAEGRRASETFHPDYYWYIRPDVNEVWPGDYKMCARHYAGHGIKAGITAYDSKTPTISDVSITNISENGYTVICKVSDNWGIRKVVVAAWTSANDQDDLAADFMDTQKATKNGDYYTFRVKASDHNNEKGTYVTHVYAVDLGGNQTKLEKGNVTVSGKFENKLILLPISSCVISDNFVKNVNASTNATTLLNQFDNVGHKVYDANGVEYTSKAVVGTGATVKLLDGSSVADTVSVIVPGDVDGDGLVTTTDCIRIKASFLGTFDLTACQFVAADDDENQMITSTDYMRLKYNLLNAKDESDVASKPSLEFSDALYVTESGSSAQVITAAGSAYKASGYISFDKDLFTVKDNFKITLSGKQTFNRLTLCYVASNPMKCTVTYKVGSSSISDLFYLEAGTQTFSALIKGYLESKKATEITSMSFSTCEGVVGTFALCSINTEDYPVYSNGTYYIENNYYKLGIDLSWGGGINYLYDKKNRSDGLTNLVNQYDTGRLIQQSYYGTDGTSGDGYKTGYYNSTVWPYNPVQGGDKGNNASRILDIVVGKESVYIKGQPMDWGHENSVTPSYMENVYILDSNLIRVDNRFVDFSGYTHRSVHQELPAFYTVSYLDNFTYYAGSKPWTNDTLTSRNDLKFWGGEYHNDCEFRMRQSNTETWCAWTNSTTTYGIGLYVPKIDVFLAGRSGTGMTKDPSAAATNYVAPLNQLLLVSYTPLEYSYLMTTGRLEYIRETFKENKDFATNDSLLINRKNYRIPD